MEKTERDRDKIKTERSIEAEKWREGKAKGDKDGVRQRKRSKQQEWEERKTKDGGESPFLQSLQPAFPRVWAPLAFLWFP